MVDLKAERGGGRVPQSSQGWLEGLVEALADKHSQVDINFNGVTMRLPNSPVGVELNGLLTLTVHMRDLTDDEARASAARNVAAMAFPKP
jgi:hypothetical protein